MEIKELKESKDQKVLKEFMAHKENKVKRDH